MFKESSLRSLIKKMGVPVKKLKVGSGESFLFFEISGVPYYVKLSS